MYPAPIGAPGVGAPGQPVQVQGAKAVADTQSVDAVVQWFFTNANRGANGAKFKRRLAARQKFDAAHPAVVVPAPSGRDLTLDVSGPLPKDAPDGAIYALSVTTYPSDEAGADQIARTYGVQSEHQVVDPKSPDAPPQDVIKIAKGPLAWTIDRLTGLVSFDKQHNDGVLPVDVKQAQGAAEAFVRDHGGMPDDAVLGEPLYDLSKGDGSGAPKPKRITFVWHHKDKGIFGNDAIAADVTVDASSGGGLPVVQVAPPPAAPAPIGQPAATARPSVQPAAIVAQWGVTHMTRLWRVRGNEIDKASSLLTADAAIEKLKQAAIPGVDPSKTLAVSDVRFGEFRDAASVAQTETRPVWGMNVAGQHVDVDARTGEVLVTAPLPLAAPASTPVAKGKRRGNHAKASAPPPAASAAASAAASGAPAAAASPDASGSASAPGASPAASPSASAAPAPSANPSARS